MGKKGTNEENFSRGIWGITRQIDRITFSENLKGTRKDLEEFVFYRFYYFPLFDFCCLMMNTLILGGMTLLDLAKSFKISSDVKGRFLFRSSLLFYLFSHKYMHVELSVHRLKSKSLICDEVLF